MAKPSRNQKVMSDEEKEKLIEGSIKKKEQDSEDMITIKQAESVIFERYKETLPQVLEQRLNDLESTIEKELQIIKGLPAPRIHSLLASKVVGLNSYSATEILLSIEYYMKMVETINKYTIHVPSITEYCGFMGFSTNTYQNWLAIDDNDKRNSMRIVDDYIKGQIFSASKMRKIDNATSIFDLKTEHQLSEAVNPQYIAHTETMNKNQVNALIDRIKNESAIEVKEKK